MPPFGYGAGGTYGGSWNPAWGAHPNRNRAAVDLGSSNPSDPGFSISFPGGGRGKVRSGKQQTYGQGTKVGPQPMGTSAPPGHQPPAPRGVTWETPFPDPGVDTWLGGSGQPNQHQPAPHQPGYDPYGIMSPQAGAGSRYGQTNPMQQWMQQMQQGGYGMPYGQGGQQYAQQQPGQGQGQMPWNPMTMLGVF